MKLLLFLGLFSMLLLGPTAAASRHRRQQPENTGNPMNMPDLDEHAEFSDNNSVPLIPLNIQPPAIDSLEENNEEQAVSNKDSLPIIPLGITPPSLNSNTDSLPIIPLGITPPSLNSNTDSLPIIPLGITPPSLNSNTDSLPIIPLGITPPSLNSNTDSLPIIPLGIKPPTLNAEKTTATSAKCTNDYCQLWKPCPRNSTCITLPPPDCSTRCLPHGSEVTLKTPAIEDVLPEDATTLTPRRACPGGFLCVHGVPSHCNFSSTEGITCKCDPGWTGSVCHKPCNLTCVHGVCGVKEDGGMFCNCEPEYIGKACDELMPDPEEKTRILAAVLTCALVVALILIIAIPIIMWRLRVILILKLVYMFKEYEDEDGKEIDAYVSMTSSANTESFVYGSLQPILEKHNFKLFIQARDAPAGEVMSEIILSAVEKSRRTIMIITPDYITNEWSRFEYLIAQRQALKLHQRIIPIILEDVGKESVNMDKSLKHILDSIKCLKYPKVKPKSISSSPEEISENIQSPDSNKSVNSTTHFYMNGRSNSTVSLPKEEEKFERKAAKFWKRLVLTMPKKKSPKNTPSSFVPTLGKQVKYEINKSDCKSNYEIIDCDKQIISQGDSKINFFNDIHHDAFYKLSGNSCKAEDTTDVNFHNDKLLSTII
ncbi:hypothetical protein BsWGS_02988 [Bradybaena similaris]